MHSINRATERGEGGRKQRSDGVTGGGIQLGGNERNFTESAGEGGIKETNLNTSSA